MKKIFRILVVSLLLSFVWLFCSCGARKSETTKTKESIKSEFTDQSKSEQTGQTQAKSETNVKKTEVITVDDHNQTTTKKETVEPIDPTKPASYVDENGQKQELNNSKKTTETTTQNNNTKTEVQTKTEASGKTETQSNKKATNTKNIKAKSDSEKLAKAKVVNREAWSVWNWLWVLIPTAVLYYVWKNRVTIGKKISGVWWV